MYDMYTKRQIVRDKTKKQLVTNIKITGTELTNEQIEEKIDAGDLTGFTSILQVPTKESDVPMHYICTYYIIIHLVNLVRMSKAATPTCTTFSELYRNSYTWLLAYSFPLFDYHL